MITYNPMLISIGKVSEKNLNSNVKVGKKALIRIIFYKRIQFEKN